ncbi:hypothetical protein ABTY20_13495 [Streptomyces sp. NPDC126497]|uniref:hypothetical protein n=1 Tax=Streptomyces sp. NPDC126497 TaxID=3155313 RepID=UPI00331E3E11
MATGDFTGDVHLFRGGKGGLTGSRSSWIAQTVLGPADERDAFGASLRLRDLTADGRADPALGVNDGIVPRGTSTVPTTTGAIRLPEFGGGFPDWHRSPVLRGSGPPRPRSSGGRTTRLTAP